MKYTKKEFRSFQLHMIETDKFKSVNVEVILKDKVKKDEITIRNMLADILAYSTKKYPTRYDFSIAHQDLYALKTFSYCGRMGNFYTTVFQLNFLNEKYTENGMLEESIRFLGDMLFHPNVENNRFDSVSFDIIKRNLKAQIERVREDPRKYSMIRMLEHMDQNSNYACHSFGYLEDLEKITEESLYQYYKEFFCHADVDIFIIGEFDSNKVEKIMKEVFQFDTIKKDKGNIRITHDKFKMRPKVIKEQDDSTQAKLCIGCKMKDLSRFERNYALTMYNMILGGSSESKLFRVVREKNSLCYYISSSTNKLDNLFFITSGINEENFDKTIKLIKKEMKDMKQGNITKEEIEKAQTEYIAMLDEIEDYPVQIISSYYAMKVMDIDDIKTRKEKILEVTIEDIKTVATKIHMDVIYLLGGETNGEDRT